MRSQRKRDIRLVTLLMLPVAVLLGTGLYLLRQDKTSVETEAREAAEVSAGGLLANFARSRSAYDPAVYLNPTNEWPQGTVLLQVNSDRHLVFPPPLDTIAQVGQLTASQYNLWRTAQSAEFRTNDIPTALQLWDQLLQDQLSPGTEAVARFQRAVLLEKSGRLTEAVTSFQSLVETPPGTRLESGLAVAPLAALKLLRSESFPPVAKGSRIVHGCITNLLMHPTQFTPQLLALGRNSSAAGAFGQAERCWGQHELAREIHAAVLRQITSNSSSSASFWVTLPSQDRWCVFRSETNLFARSAENLVQTAERHFRALAPALPRFLSLTLRDGDTTIFATSTSSASPDRLWLSTAASDDPELRCDLKLEDESMLFARQRQRARVFGALLATAAACAAFGVLQAQRSLRKQERLSDMKSNFVSSVSHELRAPLGSLRLISEALQSGRVLDPEKQNEYFNLLVQESRRLSGLIENVLEFSRIEQDSRTLTFDPVDLRELCASAAKSVAPIAAERGVSIQMSMPDQTEPCIVNGDALALERAVANLLDNAIKHSPSGESVTVKLDRSANGFEISVSDHGPGIPVAEHKRIFERFYRLGSELRRETTGIGIGLSIVQHTVQAHGGTVTVNSSPGRGATFAIHLPYAPTSQP
jgi:signal transduction histidine kinase